jgi:hypothetical protein
MHSHCPGTHAGAECRLHGGGQPVVQPSRGCAVLFRTSERKIVGGGGTYEKLDPGWLCRISLYRYRNAACYAGDLAPLWAARSCTTGWRLGISVGMRGGTAGSKKAREQPG